MSQSTTSPRATGRTGALISLTLALLAGTALRIWMFREFYEANGDPLVYGAIAKNLLLHHGYALTLANGETFPTLIRLPGYPLFLALCFKLFGMENYASAVFVQILLDLVACLLIADCTRRIAPASFKSRATHAALWIAALCPFTAIYAASPLTEGPTIFALSLAMWSVACFQQHPRWATALLFTFAVTFAALLRPDGLLAALAFTPAMFLPLRSASTATRVRIVRIAIVCFLLAVAPFAAWTIRNASVFHVFQPLVPKSATDPGDPLSPGWDRWLKTWCLDYVSTYDISWSVPDSSLDINKLPARAFDSPGQYDQTAALAAEYNRNGYALTSALDDGFARLAQQRIDADPARYYLWLPIGRVVDMWLRPRVENLPIDLDWWVYAHHHVETRFSYAYAALNFAYLVLGLWGLLLRPRLAIWMLAYILLRSAMLFTICPPEARYTIECFPMLIALGGVALGSLYRPRSLTIHQQTTD